jgi:hypothetical protein
VDATALTQVAPSFTALLERIGTDVAKREPTISLADAIKQGDAEAVGVLLKGGVDAAGFVHAALRTGNLEIVSLVLEHRGDPNERGGIGGETPLFVAARENRPDIVQLLLARGADPDARCSTGGTAMEMAAPWPRVLEIWRAREQRRRRIGCATPCAGSWTRRRGAEAWELGPKVSTTTTARSTS